MKKFLAVLILAFTTTIATAQNQGNTFMFTGKLISAPTSVASCGTIAVAYAYEFEITMISDESYTQQNIAIVVDCPDLLGANFFKVDATYKMELFDANGNNYSVMNQSVLDSYNLAHNYYAGDIKRLQ